MRYLDPRSVKISLIVTSDDFLNEVTAGSESASLPEEKRRASVVERLAHVENRLQVTVHPIVSGHRRRYEGRMELGFWLSRTFGYCFFEGKDDKTSQAVVTSHRTRIRFERLKTLLLLLLNYLFFILFFIVTLYF